MSITRIQGLKVDNFGNSNELVIPYLMTTSDNDATMQYTYAKAPGITMIAPLDVAYQVNADLANVKYKEVAGNIKPTSIILDCGNGSRQVASQKVNGAGYVEGKNAFFDSTCLYTQKGTYTPTMTFTYIDPVKQQSQSFTLPAGTINIIAQINMSADGKPLITNSGNTELIA